MHCVAQLDAHGGALNVAFAIVKIPLLRQFHDGTMNAREQIKLSLFNTSANEKAGQSGRKSVKSGSSDFFYHRQGTQLVL